jgi:hypothetical protein
MAFIWRVLHLTFDLRAPDNIRDVFDDWVQNMKSNNKKIFFVEYGPCYEQYDLAEMILYLTKYIFHLKVSYELDKDMYMLSKKGKPIRYMNCMQVDKNINNGDLY